MRLREIAMRASAENIRISSPIIGEEEIESVKSVMLSGMLAQGACVREFEREFADFTGVEHAVAVSSGTAAIHIALLAAGIGRGDEVITTPFTFISTANAVLFTGAKPVFVDVREDDFNIDVEQVNEAVSRRTKAVIPVHLYGQPCDMHALMEIAEDYDLIVIEDACQAHGAEYHGKKAGAIGTAGCFSFYATKNMTTGEGGMITTDIKEIADRARMIRNHGSTSKYTHEMLGFNMRMTDICAAIGISQLKKLPLFTMKRRKNAEYLTENLKNIPNIITPVIKDGRTHVFHQYTIRVVSDELQFSHERRASRSAGGAEGGVMRDMLADILRRNGVEVGIYYPIPVHKQPLYRKLGYGDISLPVSERLAKEVLSLPVHPGVERSDIERIADVIRDTMNC
ncbi:MAG: DegT/DnrJ/EryC1/StrS family aminotransferase [Canidatus Methanoxibalbensis ujae]|nr:DegT/DnrJ/EryC1/StrS family aminotransferase [Candidatus Methanoxibalbensis ujae]